MSIALPPDRVNPITPGRESGQLAACESTPGIAPLGITTKSSSLGHPCGFQGTSPVPSTMEQAKDALVFPESDPDRRLERYALQSVVRRLVPESRTAGCMRYLAYGSHSVPVMFSKEKRRASYRGLQVCSAVWLCPVCSARVAETRRQELRSVVAAHRATGGHVLLLTLTFSHSREEPLSQLLGGLSRAEKRFKGGKLYSAIVSEFGIVGTVRAKEITWGSKNGWHPHIHSLLFLKRPLSPEEIAALKVRLYARWVAACEAAGLGTPSFERGIDLKDGSYADRYVSKWGLEDELTKSHLKKGRGSNFSPRDLLRLVHQSTSEAVRAVAAAKWKEYAAAIKGSRQLVYSSSLKALLQPITDEEAANKVAFDDALLATITESGWKLVIRKKELRGSLLESASSGSRVKLLGFLNTHRGDMPLRDLVVMPPEEEDAFEQGLLFTDPAV